jgi:hypothetical protein
MASTALNCIHSMPTERCARAKITSSSRPSFSGPVQSLDNFQSVPRISSSISTATKTISSAPKEDNERPKISESLDIPDEGRDVGVSDAVWQQLQKDKREAELQIQQAAQITQEQELAQRLAEEAEKEAEKVAAELREIQAKLAVR